MEGRRGLSLRLVREPDILEASSMGKESRTPKMIETTPRQLSRQQHLLCAGLGALARRTQGSDKMMEHRT